MQFVIHPKLPIALGFFDFGAMCFQVGDDLLQLFDGQSLNFRFNLVLLVKTFLRSSCFQMKAILFFV